MLINKKSSEMITELRESGRWCCVKLLSDYMYVWDVVLYEAYPRNDDHKPTIRSGSYKDLNKAIKDAYDKAQIHIEKEESDTKG